MAKEKRVQDEFSSIVYQTVTEAAANTLTFAQIQTGYGSLQKTGWVLHKLEYYISAATLDLLQADDDILQIALVTSNLVTTLSLADASLVDLLELGLAVYTSVGVSWHIKPIIRDFTTLPGGGKLILPYPLWLGIRGTSLGAACTGALRMYFTERDLKDSEWMDLVQQTRLLS